MMLTGIGEDGTNIALPPGNRDRRGEGDIMRGKRKQPIRLAKLALAVVLVECGALAAARDLRPQWRLT